MAEIKSRDPQIKPSRPKEVQDMQAASNKLNRETEKLNNVATRASFPHNSAAQYNQTMRDLAAQERKVQQAAAEHSASVKKVQNLHKQPPR